MTVRRWLALVGLAVVGAVAEPRAPVGVGLELPLCWQVELPPGLLAALSAVTVNPSPLPAPVRLTTPAAAGLPGVVEVAGAGPLGVGPGAVTLGSAGPVALPGAVGLPAESPPAVPATVGEAALVLAAVRAGDRSHAALAKLAELPTATLVAALAAGDDWRAEEQPYLDALALVLLSRPEVDPLDESLPRRARRFLADSLSRRGDGRCVAIYEGLLQAYEAQPAAGWVHEVAGLAGYWRAVKQPARSAEAWLRATAWTSSPGLQADYKVEAARDLAAAGQPERAEAVWEEAYGEANRAGFGWVAGMSLYDRIERRLREGRAEEALALCRRPVTGDRADAVAVMLAWQAGRAECRAGRVDAALAHLQAALAARQKLGDAPAGRLVDGFAQRAASGLKQLHETAAGLACPQTAGVRRDPQTGIGRTTIRLQSLADAPLTVTGPTGVVGQPTGRWSEHGLALTQAVLVTVTDPAALPAQLTVRQGECVREVTLAWLATSQDREAE